MKHPSRLGPYRIFELLGAGGMGAVYRASRVDLEREVALKVVPAAVLATRVMRHRFRREARALAAVRHPNVVALLDADLDHEPPYLAMELVRGHSLERLVGPGYPAWERGRAARLLRDVAAGLGALHRAGLVHRDIKPANVLEDEGARFRLTDFGLVGGEGFTRLTGQGDILGTPAYLSPEAWKGGAITPAADVFQAGVLAYEAWTGTSPYGNDLMEIALNTGEGTLSKGNLEDDALGQVILRCLYTDPARRFQDGAQLLQALEACGAEGSVDLPPPPAARPPSPDSTGTFPVSRPGAARRTWPVALGFGALFLLSALSPSAPDARGTEASALHAEAGPAGLVCTWLTDVPTSSRLLYWDEQDPEAPRLRVRIEAATRQHRVEVPVLPGRRYQVAVEAADGTPSLPTPVSLPRQDLQPRDIERELPAGAPDRLRLTTPFPCRASLRVGGEVRAAEAGPVTEHRLELAGLGPDDRWEDAVLELAGPEGAPQHLPLPGVVRGRVGYLVAELADIEREVLEEIGARPMALRLFSAEGRREIVRALVVRRVFERLDRLKPALQEAFRDPSLELGHRLALYHALASFDHLDFSEDSGGRPEPLFGVAPLFAPLVKARLYSAEDAWDRHLEVFGAGRWGWLAGDTSRGILYQTVVEELQTRIQRRIPGFRPEPVPQVSGLVTPGAARRRVHLAFGAPLPTVFSCVEADVEGRVRLRLPRLIPLRGAATQGEAPVPDGTLALGWELDPALLGGVARRVTLRTVPLPGLPVTGSAMGVKDLRWRFE